MKNQRLIDMAMNLVAWIVAIVASMAALLWILAFLANPKNAYIGGSLFTLAQVVAIFAAFGFAAGFSSYGSPKLKRALRGAGIWHVVAALGCTLVGMALPYYAVISTEAVLSDVLKYLISVAFAIVGLSFSWGTFLWVRELPRIVEIKST